MGICIQDLTVCDIGQICLLPSSIRYVAFHLVASLYASRQSVFVFVYCLTMHLSFNLCVGWVDILLFSIPGPDCIRIPYGTKLSLYMSKDTEGTAGTSVAYISHAASLMHATTETHPVYYSINRRMRMVLSEICS